MSDVAPSAKVKANQHESYWSYSILAALIPVIGLLLGIIFMTKDDKLDRKLGEHVLVVSILFMIIYPVVLYLWSAHNAIDTLNSYTT